MASSDGRKGGKPEGAGTSGGRATRVHVAVRVRPFLAGEESAEQNEGSCLKVGTEGKVTVTELQRAGKSTEKSYTFDTALGPSSTQADVEHAIKLDSFVEQALTGYDVAVLAYGQTGSGKTYTVAGPRPEGSEMTDTSGILQRMLQKLLGESQESYDVQASCKCVEVYNEQVRDLLSVCTRSKQNLPVRFDPGSKGFYAEGVRSVPVQDDCPVASALQVHADAQSQRSVRSHKLNEASSRSHSLFTVQLQSKPKDSNVRRQGSFTIVDLAGSERLKDVDAGGASGASKEAGSINSSLFVLGKVVARLAESPLMKQGYPQVRMKRIRVIGARVLSCFIGSW